ncbi:hypothetical protein F0562_008511 [Nyssa sinensis]|uniref:Uncharacterized protein n=1 Tax=Nyssa sinensis TaxID=561372 RepID=A0A5J5A905_9ASTE|nr:hypothetical protein F0562_008511 [Nyssa sinensis]
MGCNSHKKGPTSFRELLADRSTEWEIGSASPVVEKTLYIDSVHNVESPNPNSNSFSSDKKGLPDSRENDLEIVAKTGRTKKPPWIKNLHQESITSAKLPDNGNLDSEDQQPTKVENVENSHGSYTQFPLPPPPPKSPSESWLWRTLPSMSSRNPSSWSYLGTRTNTRNHAAKTTSVDPKWETIVKTAKVQHQHLRFSEELLTPVPET